MKPTPAPSRDGLRSDRTGKRLIAGHFDAEIARRLKILAATQDQTIHALLAEALELLFTRYQTMAADDPAGPKRARRAVPRPPRTT